MGQLDLRGEERLRQIVGSQGGLAPVVADLRRVLGVRVNVLVLGESGTGKEVIARALHEADPRRRHRPFVPLNCAALPEALLEAELFGYRQGAFTGAAAAHAGDFLQAEGGTLFLDEVGELPLALQPKLLRVLQERAVRRLGETREVGVDVRVVAATSRELGAAACRGEFRADLYYRLADFVIRVPPLRQRRQDLILLALHFLRACCRDFGREPCRLSPAAVAWLEARDWARNNVRELQVALKRALLLCEGSCIEPEHLEAAQLEEVSPAGALHQKLRAYEQVHLEEALARSQGNISAAARLLEMKRSTLCDRLARLGIRRQGRERD
ncbi:MAG: sigma-54-dependent Fis family transcriptional regulator [Candidatus Latescibacteria bacterium]|nr:sigma-54-dependent Fis family transcriptional regulator [Candidatus Latescibacterota bacterium]